MKQGSRILLIASVFLSGCAVQPTVNSSQEQVHVPSPVSDVAISSVLPLSSDVLASQESAKEVIKLTPESPSTTTELPPPLFAIQILGLSDQTKISTLVDELPMGMPAWIVESERQGQAWYSLLVGNYSTYDMAKRSLSELGSKGLPDGAFVKEVPLEGTIRLR
jgi:septal ring-binding cell division protein DamX